MVGNVIIFPGKNTFFQAWYHILKKDKAVLEPRVLPAFVITCIWNYCNIRFDPIHVKVICANLPKDHYVQVP